MSIKRVRLPGRGQVPIDDRYEYVPVGADAIDVNDFEDGYAAFEFPCHPRMLAGLQLSLDTEYQVWEQTCPRCGRQWRFIRGQRVVRWEPLHGSPVDPDTEPTNGVDMWGRPREAIPERAEQPRLDLASRGRCAPDGTIATAA